MPIRDGQRSTRHLSAVVVTTRKGIASVVHYFVRLSFSRVALKVIKCAVFRAVLNDQSKVMLVYICSRKTKLKEKHGRSNYGGKEQNDKILVCSRHLIIFRYGDYRLEPAVKNFRKIYV
ncbi:Uncharacterised protein at_DN0552 [Pycnogonum litorale]